MKISQIFLWLLLLATVPSFPQATTLQSIFESRQMNGTIMVFNPIDTIFAGYHAELWDSGYLPASTFKIPNSLIGLETGVIDTNYIFKWTGGKRRLPLWDKDMNLREAFRVSCVPCYQELARKIGVDSMKKYTEQFQYGSMDIHANNLDLFWLEGNSRISPRQQIEFLQKLHDGTLLLKPSTMDQLKSIMVNEKTDLYTLYAKTGWSIRNGNNYGWFVGWVEVQGEPYYFATLLEPMNQKDFTGFANTRKEVTLEALRFLGVVP